METSSLLDRSGISDTARKSGWFKTNLLTISKFFIGYFKTVTEYRDLKTEKKIKDEEEVLCTYWVFNFLLCGLCFSVFPDRHRSSL